MNNRPRAIVLGIMCDRLVPGVVWQVLHYLWGLERLGFEAYYVEWHGRWVPDPYAMSPGEPRRILIGPLLDRAGFANRWICRADHVAGAGAHGGLAKEALPDLYRQSEVLLNVTGSHLIEDAMFECPRRLYIESDPGIPQIEIARGDTDRMRVITGHTHHFTFGENIGGPDTLLPATQVAYQTTRQPIVLHQWVHDQDDDGSYTTVSRWRKPRPKRVSVGEETYEWDKGVEFLKLSKLPLLAPRPLELALAGATSEDRDALTHDGWRTRDAIEELASLEEYRTYVQRSRGELTVAKDQYVRLRTGWFSDRSACYLAAGRPVVTQDTRLDGILPLGTGLLLYDDAYSAARAIEEIEGDYERHRSAASEIAREYFDSDKVLGALLGAVGLETSIANRVGS